MWQLSNPRLSGHVANYEDEAECLYNACVMLGVPPEDAIVVDSPDGKMRYIYRDQDEADADQDGAYAVNYREVVE